VKPMIVQPSAPRATTSGSGGGSSVAVPSITIDLPAVLRKYDVDGAGFVTLESLKPLVTELGACPVPCQCTRCSVFAFVFHQCCCVSCRPAPCLTPRGSDIIFLSPGPGWHGHCDAGCTGGCHLATAVYVCFVYLPSSPRTYGQKLHMVLTLNHAHMGAHT
jgi:hypothetical protein